MAEPHAHSQPIQTYGPAPHNRNIWPHNSRAPPSRLADSFVCFGDSGLPTTVNLTLSIMQALTIFSSQSYIVHNPRSVTLIFAQYNLTTVKYVSKYANKNNSKYNCNYNYYIKFTFLFE